MIKALISQMHRIQNVKQFEQWAFRFEISHQVIGGIMQRKQLKQHILNCYIASFDIEGFIEPDAGSVNAYVNFVLKTEGDIVCHQVMCLTPMERKNVTELYGLLEDKAIRDIDFKVFHARRNILNEKENNVLNHYLVNANDPEIAKTVRAVSGKHVLMVGHSPEEAATIAIWLKQPSDDEIVIALEKAIDEYGYNVDRNKSVERIGYDGITPEHSNTSETN